MSESKSVISIAKHKSLLKGIQERLSLVDERNEILWRDNDALRSDFSQQLQTLIREANILKMHLRDRERLLEKIDTLFASKYYRIKYEHEKDGIRVTETFCMRSIHPAIIVDKVKESVINFKLLDISMAAE